MGKSYYARIDQQVYGPLDAATLKQWAVEGRISRDDHLSRDGKTGWVKAETAQALFSSPLPPQPPEVIEPSDEEVVMPLTVIKDGSVKVTKSTLGALASMASTGSQAIKLATETAMARRAEAEVERLRAQAIASEAKQREIAIQQEAARLQPVVHVVQAQPQVIYRETPPAPQQPQQIIVNTQIVNRATQAAPPGKSALVAFLLAFLFGPLGMLYSTVLGAVVVFVLGIVLIPFTAGISVPVMWAVGCVWAALAA